MNNLRISEKNNIYNKISEIKKYIDRHTATCERLASQGSSEFNIKQIEKLTCKINEYETELIDLNTRINDVSIGKFDDELTKLQTTNKTIISDKKEISDKKIKDKNIEKNESQQVLQKYYDDNKKHRGESQYSVQKEAGRFFKNCSEVPDYMLKSLSEMQNNKGYMWRGCLYLGQKNSRNLPNELIIFEKCKNSLMKITEVTSEQVKHYEKAGKELKVLIQTERR